MDGDGFKDALAALGHTQTSFAREQRFPVRTIQNWTRSGPPEHVAHMVSTMLRQKIEAPTSLTWPSDNAAACDAARALDGTLTSVLQRVTRAGWPRDVAVAGAITWFARQLVDKR